MPSRKKQMTYSQRPTHAARAVHARGERQFRTYDTSYIRPKSSKAPIIFSIVLAIVVLGGLAWGALTLFNSCSGSQVELLAEGQEATVVVEEGAGAQAIGQNLADARLVASSSEFTKRVSELGVADQLKPGTYTFAGGTSLDDIIRALEAGPDMGNALTIPEGYKLDQIAASVAEFTENRITAEDFAAAASDTSVYAKDYPFLADAGTNKLEGFLFPKTYAISEDATADSIIRMMLDQFKTETAGLDWSYPEGKGLNAYQALNLASIVEKEAGPRDDVRAHVAGVFYNRLDTEGDPTYGHLQSDATTAYEVGHEPTDEEVHAETPYSTYTNTGLPPTPICSPSIESLKAVLAPEETDDFFFYFEEDENGEMQYYFSKTYEEHQQTFS